jgi:hypothetical protein
MQKHQEARLAEPGFLVSWVNSAGRSREGRAGSGGGSRTHMVLRPADFKSASCANSDTPPRAWLLGGCVPAGSGKLPEGVEEYPIEDVVLADERGLQPRERDHRL